MPAGGSGIGAIPVTTSSMRPGPLRVTLARPAGATGAILLANVEGAAIAPYVSGYLVAMGGYIIFKGLQPLWPREVRDWIVPFAGLGGRLLDAAGGGGWGPIVTGSLIGRGHEPRRVIGSTNLTEFAVTATISAAFFLTLGWSELSSAIGLIIGGVLAAPLGGYLVARIPTRPLMLGVGVLIILISVPRLF